MPETMPIISAVVKCYELMIFKAIISKPRGQNAALFIMTLTMLVPSSLPSRLLNGGTQSAVHTWIIATRAGGLLILEMPNS
jgi:hypothetical protein